jgi:hypothetical protein
MVWKPTTTQLELVLPGAPASQFHPTAVERRGRRSGSLIRQALDLDQEDAYAAGEAVPPASLGVGFLARALVQATLPHSDPKANELVRRNGHFTESDGRQAGDGFLVAEKRALRWDSRQPNGDVSWGSHVVLAERFFKEATEAPVPLDLRVLRALRSPFEIDVYVWLTWRFFRLRKPVTIPWPSLALQFGSGYANPRHF